MKKIEVADEVGDAFNAVLNNSKTFWQLALAPMVFAALWYLVASWIILGSVEEATSGGGYGIAGDIFVMIVDRFIDFGVIAITALFLVPWHRFVLSGGKKNIEKQLSSQPGHGKFILHSFLFTLMSQVVFIALVILMAYLGGSSGSYIVVFGIPGALALAYLYLVLRFSLIFPSICANEGASWGRSWRLTDGNGVRLLLASLAIGILLALLGFIVSFLATAILSEFRIVHAILNAIIVILVGWFGLTAGAALLSNVYRKATKKRR